MTQGERLARIETLLESLPEMKADIKAIRADLDRHKVELSNLKNRGAGILTGVAIAAGAVGANSKTVWQWFVGLFH